MEASNQKTLGIVVGGGPAPGINGVIASVTIEAINNGYRVLGFIEGFNYLIKQDDKQIMELTINNVSRLHFEGGSILKTSRANPTKNEQDLKNCVSQLLKHNVSLLVTIGGDDTAYSSMKISEAANNQIRVCHVPKTIDNDLPLPQGVSTFGYQTAREVGASIVKNLMTDAKTASRYFIVIAMGRQAGHLALGIGKSAGATLSLIPEEFGDKVTMKNICDTIEGCIIKRLTHEKDHGVIILAEGLLERMDIEELKQYFGDQIKYDAHGHIQLAELDIGKVVRDEMRLRVEKRKLKINFTEKNLGYELRCAPPNAFDREYTRDLGNGAVQYLLKGGNGSLITFIGERLVPVSFDDLKDPKTGKARVRNVNIHSESYQISTKYMIRLTKKDFEDQEKVNLLAKYANCSVDEFVQQFKHIAK
ncbi:hypothetical protein ABK040_003211 [Willaertia magna]